MDVNVSVELYHLYVCVCSVVYMSYPPLLETEYKMSIVNLTYWMPSMRVTYHQPPVYDLSPSYRFILLTYTISHRLMT